MKVFRTSSKEWTAGSGYTKKVLAGADVLREGLLLQEVRFKKGESIPPHYHKKQTEIFFALAGGSITIEGKRVDFSAGDIVVCEPGEVHGMPLIENDFGFLVLKLDYNEDDTVWLK